MIRSSLIVAVLLSLVGTSPAVAAELPRWLSADIEDVDSLVYLAETRKTLFGWVEQKIADVESLVSTETSLDAAQRKEILRGLTTKLVNLSVRWAEHEGDVGDYEKSLEGYRKAIRYAERIGGGEQLRERWVLAVFEQAERLGSGSEAEREEAGRLLATILDDPKVKSADRDRAKGGLIGIDEVRAQRMIEDGDLTGGVALLAEVHQKALDVLGATDARTLELKRSLDEIERTTALIEITTFDVGSALDGLPEGIVGKALPVAGSAGLHPIRGFRAQAEPSTTLEIPGRLRLSTRDGGDFELRLARGSGGPPIRIPIRVEAGVLKVAIPNRIPARMAWVPDGSFFVMLYELSRDELNEVHGRTSLGGDKGRRPAGIQSRDLSAVARRHPMLKLPTAAQWKRAALWIDGRPYPWGSDTDVTAHAALDTGVTWSVDKGDAGPFGLHNAIGNVWEVLRDDHVVGGGKYSPGRRIELVYHDGTTKKRWTPDVVDDPFPLPNARDGDGKAEAAKLQWEKIRSWCHLDATDDEQIGVRFVLEVREGR